MTDSPDELNARRDAVRARLLAEAGIGRVGPQPIDRVSDDETPVLTDAQERLWFLHHFEDDPSSLNVHSACRVGGPFEPDRLPAILAAIVDRHDVLGWAIANVGGEPTPRRHADPKITFLLEDHPASNPVDAAATVDRVLREEAGRVFDLEAEVPIAIRVVALSPTDHLVSVTMHHAVSDDSSQRIFWAELLERYDAATSGREPQLADIPIRYRDYAAWQRDRLTGPLGDQLDHWRTVLDQPPATSDLPADRNRPARHTVESGSVRRRIGGALGERVRAYASQTRATPFMVLLTGYGLALGRAAGQEDLLIGTPVAGRGRAETESMLGVFINTLVLRLAMPFETTFADAVDGVRDTALAAFANQDVPFERLLAELRPPRDPSRTPFFSTMFNMTSAATPPSTLGDLELSWLEVPDVGAKFDLTVYVHDAGDGFELLAVFNRNLYDESTVEGFVDQMIGILDLGLTNPTATTTTLFHDDAAPALPRPDAPIDATWPGTVASAVRRHAARRGEHPAAVDATTTWTYRDLDSGSRAIAARLHELGATRGHHVAIIGDRSAALAPALLGALRAGTPYVVLDPAHPAERIDRYRAIVRPTVNIVVHGSDSPSADLHRSLSDVASIVVGPAPSDLPAAWRDLPFDEPELGPSDPACLTFTSGSTGVPKAVVGAHGSLTAFFDWMSDEFGVGPDDRFSLLSGLAHDPIQRDLFWAMWVGATVVAPDASRMPDPGYVAGWLADAEISVAHLTPAMGHLTVDTAKIGTLPALRRALFIGDRLTGALVAGLDALAPTADIINLYGTTETQRASAWYRLTSADRANPEPSWVAPLGQAMPGCQLHLETADGGQTPRGAIGHLIMRSPWLALGYLADDHIDDELFPAAPSGEAGLERAYRTGDLARLRRDGTIEHRGRADDQIKVRGFRIEPFEIESTLGSLPEIERCAVAIYDRQSPAIGAYVIPAASAQLTDADVLALARRHLPPAMVPTRVLVTDTIPLTPNGKVDAGPLRNAVSVGRGAEPSDELERDLVRLWGDVLGRRDLGVHDDFFDVGGYSLLATRLFALIDEQIGVTLPVSMLFEAPTVAALADRIRMLEAGHERTPFTSVVPIQPTGAKQPFFYVMPYTISVLQLSTLGEVLGDSQPLYGIQPQGLEPGQVVHTSVEDMAEFYLREVREAQPTGPYALGGHCAGSLVAFEMCKQLEASGEAVNALVLVDQGPPGERPPIIVWRYILHRIKFFFTSGRLRHALQWQFKLLSGRVLLRRVGTPRKRRTELVRAAHREAHAEYAGGDVAARTLLLRSEETIALGDREWHLRWGERTSGAFESDTVAATHAMLLERPYVEQLAEKLRRFLDSPAD